MTRRFQANALERLAAAVFEAHGTPPQEAQTAARLLVQAAQEAGVEVDT